MSQFPHLGDVVIKASAHDVYIRNKPMTSLVPQVDQVNSEECLAISDQHKDETLSFEESMKFQSFQIGASLNTVVCEFWNIIAPETTVPYCMHSQNEDDSWNFSWGYDFPEQNTRSCFYTITSPEVIVCEEYPKDVITLKSVWEQINVAVVIISDLIQSNEWNKEAAIKLFVDQRMAEEKGSQGYQNRAK